MLLFGHIEFVQRIHQMLRNDVELTRFDPESTVSGGGRSTDDLARTPCRGTNQVLILLPESFSRIITHSEESLTDHRIDE